MSKKIPIPLSSDYDATISLLNAYLIEWNEREKMLWSVVFKFYYAIVIITLLPNISDYIGLKIPPIPTVIFRLIGLLLSFVFLYISMGYCIRLHASSETYQNILNKLPEEYQRKSIRQIKCINIPIGKIFLPRIHYVICFLLFLSLLFLSIVLILI